MNDQIEKLDKWIITKIKRESTNRLLRIVELERENRELRDELDMYRDEVV